jgi:ubiquinone/menaquinone biosynthesis C-methylase UbiE
MQPIGTVDSDYLKLAAELTRPAKECSYAAMRLQPGQRALDVGCGPATNTLALARLVGPQGQVTGVDRDAVKIAKAEERARAAGLDAQVAHRLGEAAQLPFEADSFDASRSERLFQHLSQPEQALAEMVRVTKPGGRVVVLDTDWGSLSIDSPLVDTERRLVRAHTLYNQQNSYSGRQLYGIFKRHGLEEIEVEMIPLFTTCYAIAREIANLDQVEQEAVARAILSEAACRQWRLSLEKAEAEGAFFASLSMVLVAGRKG